MMKLTLLAVIVLAICSGCSTSTAPVDKQMCQGSGKTIGVIEVKPDSPPCDCPPRMRCVFGVAK